MPRKKLLNDNEVNKLIESNSNQLPQLVSEGHVGFLKGEEYWQWRHTISEWRKAESEQKLKELQKSFLDKEAESFKLRAEIFSLTQIKNAKTTTEELKNEYERVKKTIEERLHQSLNDCIINDVTYEVSKPKPAQV